MFFISEYIDDGDFTGYRLNAQPVLDHETGEETGEYTTTDIPVSRVVIMGTAPDGRKIFDLPMATSVAHLVDAPEFLAEYYAKFNVVYQDLAKCCVKVTTAEITEPMWLSEYEAAGYPLTDIVDVLTPADWLSLPDPE